MKIKSLQKIIVISLIGNLILTVIKLTFGYLGNSQSLLSDGFNSLSDIIVSILLLISTKVAYKKPDKTHPYGHQKFEGLMYFLLSLILLITAIGIGYTGIEHLILISMDPVFAITPDLNAFIVSVIALIIKIFLFTINRNAFIKYRSFALGADAKNHLYDIFSTSSAVISIFLALNGFLYFESIASIFIAILVFKSSYSMIKDSISFLVDQAPDQETINHISETILNIKGVLKVDDLKVRKHMDQLYVDVEIAVNKDLSLEEAHEISENVHDQVEEIFDVIHCMVHVNPL